MTSHRLFVADSSVQTRPSLAQCARWIRDLHYFSSDMRVVEKYLAALQSVETEFVCLVPDDDITSLMPSMRVSLTWKRTRTSWRRWAMCSISAFTTVSSTFAASVISRRPSVRTSRCSASMPGSPVSTISWAVFRTDVLAAALEESLKMDIIVFQELTIMNAAAAQGKIARLPHIFSLRGMEESLSAVVADAPDVRLPV